MNDEIKSEKLVYDTENIKVFLGLGRSKTYKFLELVHKNQTPFTVYKIGKLYKIPKKSFDDWISKNY